MTDIEPALVHITGSDVPLHGSPPQRDKRSSFTTLHLTPDHPAGLLLPAGRRKYALVHAADADTVISDSLGDAANLVGTVVTKGTQWVIEHDAAVYAGATVAGGTIVRVPVTAVYDG